MKQECVGRSQTATATGQGAKRTPPREHDLSADCWCEPEVIQGQLPLLDPGCRKCGLPRRAGHLFCTCGKVYDRHELESVKIPGGFTGTASISPSMELFHATGDPQLAFPEREPVLTPFGP